MRNYFFYFLLTCSHSTQAYESTTQKEESGEGWEQINTSKFFAVGYAGATYWSLGVSNSFTGNYTDYLAKTPFNKRSNYITATTPTREFVYSNSFANAIYYGGEIVEGYGDIGGMEVFQVNTNEYLYRVNIEETSGNLEVGTTINVNFYSFLAVGGGSGGRFGGHFEGDGHGHGPSADGWFSSAEISVYSSYESAIDEFELAEYLYSRTLTSAGKWNDLEREDEINDIFSVEIAYGIDELWVSLITDAIAGVELTGQEESHSDYASAWAYADPEISIDLEEYSFNITKDLADTPLSSSLENISSVPVPSTVWFFCSGLIGLIGMRKKVAKISVL